MRTIDPLNVYCITERIVDAGGSKLLIIFNRMHFCHHQSFFNPLKNKNS